MKLQVMIIFILLSFANYWEYISKFSNILVMKFILTWRDRDKKEKREKKREKEIENH